MKLISFLLLFLTFNGFGQYCPYLGPDQFLPCGVSTTTLNADLSQCGGAGVSPNQTTNYNVTNIPFVNQTNSGTSLVMSDDSQQGPFQIGFNFCFFGTTYTQFYVGSNGWISFSAGQPTTFTSQPIPTTNALVPKNCIMGPWQDWHPGLGGQIRYQIQGIAPCRKLVVSWINVPMYSCTNLQGTFHIVIYESTNIIENHIVNKPPCLQWQNGTATQGIHNLGGTIGITSPGRNSTAWTANNNAYRWTPSGPVVSPTLTWFQVGNPNPIGTGPTITVTPPPNGANYTCHFVYPICNAGWASCNINGGLGPDTVFVMPGPPNLPNPTITSFNPNCSGSCDGLINVVPNGGTGVTTISWNGQPPLFNLTNLCSGSYTYTIVDAAGCTISGNVSLVDPPMVVANPIIASDTVCYGSTNILYTTTDLGVGYTYQWSSVGNITSGQGTNSITIDWSSLPSGFNPNSVNMVAINPNGCYSLPVTFGVNIFNLFPVITPSGPYCSYDEYSTLQGTPVGGVFSGNGVIGNNFYPLNSIGANVITYTYTQSGCIFDTTTNIVVYPQPTLSQITPYNEFYEICEGDSVVVTYNTSSTLVGNYDWVILNDTINSNLLTYSWDQFGIYIINVTQTVNGCISNLQQTTVTINECPQDLIYIPNSFTPDGDENNNTWLPIMTSGFDPYSYNLVIYDRWGEVVFESNSPYIGWDGTYNGIICQDGVYAWGITFKDETTDGKTSINGHLVLLR